MKITNQIIIAALLLISLPLTAQNNTKGYYKDVFMDSGIQLTSKRDLPVTRYLGLTLESYISNDGGKLTDMDTLMQTSTICGNAMDENGILLYPDGEPRFRMIYVNGGLAGSHGRSLTDVGRERFREFINRGGSYIGTCAGAFIASTGVLTEADTAKIFPQYLGIWPGVVNETYLFDSRTQVNIPKKSPLLKYNNFGGDFTVDSLYHTNGCHAYNPDEKTEILATFNTEGRKLERDINNKPVIWGYKANEMSGRVISCGSHPESVTSGEILDLMAAMVQYAMEGNGEPNLKGELKLSEPRKMTCTTKDNNPDFTRIGDKQYHHFYVDVPKGCKELTISLKEVNGWEDFNLYLYTNDSEFAFADNSQNQNIKFGVAKKLKIMNPKSDKLYISVFCDTTVESTETKFGTQYYGRIDVLNGVPYTIEVK